MYLCYWMKRSGLADLLPSLGKTVYVGVSAGSIVTTPFNGDAEFNLQWLAAGSELTKEGDKALGLVGFTMRVHVDREGFNTTADVEKWASGIPVPTYAIDDETAIRVTDGTPEVVSEGNWKLFPRSELRPVAAGRVPSSLAGGREDSSADDRRRAQKREPDAPTQRQRDEIRLRARRDEHPVEDE
jgi:hypothetical protein